MKLPDNFISSGLNRCVLRAYFCFYVLETKFLNVPLNAIYPLAKL